MQSQNSKYLQYTGTPQYIYSYSFWLGRKPEGEKMEDSKDWKFIEEAIKNHNVENFCKIMRYWEKDGEKFAYDDVYRDIHLLREMPYKDIRPDSAEFIHILMKLELEYDDPDLYKRAGELLVQAMEDKDESRIKMICRFIYLLGVRQSTEFITKRVDECLEAIHEKYMDSLGKVVDMQREFGFIGKKENEDNEK